MSEKVLKGFYEEDAEKDTEFYRGIKHCPAHIIEISKEVPVRLTSKSVDLEKLRKFCKENYLSYNQDILNLIEWAEKEAKKK